MLFKKIILFFVAVVGLAIFFKTETYSRWIDTFILNPNTPIEDQFAITTLEERKAYRYQNLYTLTKYIQHTLDTTKIRNAQTVVLLPPNDYLKSKGIEVLSMPEPTVFYYHTGLKAVWTTSTDVDKANWVIVPSGRSNVAFVPIRSKEELQAILSEFSKFKPTL